MGNVSQRLNGTGDGPALMIDGVLVAASEASVPLDDGLVRGDGVFEGMRLYGRRPRTPEAHMVLAGAVGCGGRHVPGPWAGGG